MAKEKSYENKIKTFLKNNNAWFIKYWGGGEFTKSGVPDILACHGGRFYGIEVKGEMGVPSELQIYNLIQIDKSGGFAILIYPKDFELLKNLILADEQNKNKYYAELKKIWHKWKVRFEL